MKIRLIFIACLALLVAACQSTAAPASIPATSAAATSAADTSTPLPQSTVASQPTKVGATAAPATAAATTSAPAAFNIDLEPLVSGLERPTYLTDASDDSGRLFVTEQPGRIRIIQKGQLLDQPFLDITDRVSSDANERGLLSVAFSPHYKSNGQFFVYYVRQLDEAVTIARFTVSTNDPNVADPNSETILLTIDHPVGNHNGGQLQFGPDGDLYIGVGDGGGQGDQHGQFGNGQNLNVLLAKLLRLDVSAAQSYAIPPSNPFVNTQDVRPEIWAYGLRNPWRFSFDRVTHDLYIADVGQDTYEEVNVQPASSQGGENYGWRSMEGLHCYNPSSGCDQSGLVLPVAEYSHAYGGCSITGGYVYRGTQYPALNGLYFFADYCSGKIWSLQRDASGQWPMTERLDSGALITSFGEDQAGELYVVDQKGAIDRLVAR
jgi:glucose/arabinose dehydrogenase